MRINSDMRRGSVRGVGRNVRGGRGGVQRGGGMRGSLSGDGRLLGDNMGGSGRFQGARPSQLGYALGFRGETAIRRYLRRKEFQSELKSRQLQIASGGRYKFFLRSKIIQYLKTEFLEVREKRLPLEQLLVAIKETEVSPEILQWLADEGLKTHPKIRIIDSEPVRYAYQPPIKDLGSEAKLLDHLKDMHFCNDGGLLRSVVEDSMPLADMYINALISKGKLVQIQRYDREHVLFYKKPDPELDALKLDDKFKMLWRKVDVSNKDIDQMKKYLKNKGLTVINNEAFDKKDLETLDSEDEELSQEVAATATTRSEPIIICQPVKRGRKRKNDGIKDNLHVDNLEDLDTNAMSLVLRRSKRLKPTDSDATDTA